MSSSCLGFTQRATTQSKKHWMYFAQTVFPVERIQFDVNNLCEVTELVISQRRHSHAKPPFAEDHRKPPVPNTAPKQRRALILPHKSAFYSCLVAVSLERHSCHTPAPEELPWWGHLWLNGEEITRKCILTLCASSEAIQEEKQRDIELTPGRFWKVLARAQWVVAWFEAQPESQGDTASAPHLPNPTKPLHHPQPEPLLGYKTHKNWGQLCCWAAPLEGNGRGGVKAQ